MKECRHCRERGKTWDGDDPKCAFPDEGSFEARNWNCAALNIVRKISHEDSPGGTWAHRDDFGACSISVVSFGGSDDAEKAGYLVLGYYKERGATGCAVVVFNGQCEPATFADVDALISERGDSAHV